MSEIANRRLFYLAAVAMVAIVLISAIALIRPPTTLQTTLQTSGQSTNPKTIQVTGTATVSAAPDMAVLVLAVQTQATSAAQAAADNAATMTDVLTALSDLGIDKSSIETVSYTLSPVYDQTTPSKLIGYSVRNAIQITLKDFSLVGKALDAAVMAGTNEVQGITFTLSNAALANLQKQALGQALQDADAQARATASNLGVSIVGPISVSPAYVFQPNLRTYSAAAQSTPIQPGTLEVTVSVQVTYQFA
jgi:uncharacterized protein YggE